jgi:hypothetical protein
LGVDGVPLLDAFGLLLGAALAIGLVSAGLAFAGVSAHRVRPGLRETAGADAPIVLGDGNKAPYLFVAEAFVAIHQAVRDRLGLDNAVSVLTVCALAGKASGLSAAEIAGITGQNANYTYTRLTTGELRHHLTWTKQGLFTLKESTRESLEACLGSL